MMHTGERAYAYAKACGIIGKSFIGRRLKSLEEAGRLSELDRMLFPSESHNLNEKELLVDLEERITGRAVNSILSIIGCFSKPPELLVLLLRSYEYIDLKNALITYMQGGRAAPVWTDIGRYQNVRFKKWPDIRAMIEGTEFEFLLDKKGALYTELGSFHLHTVLDRHFYSALWKALSLLPSGDRHIAEKILSDEVSLRNAGWALRLRTYYWMTADEVKLHLVDIPAGGSESLEYVVEKKKSIKVKMRSSGSGGNAISLANDAIHSLDFPLDDFSAWSSWRWKEFINPDTGTGFWNADPMYFQNAASRYLFRLACHNFRLRPFSMDTIFCFIKIKQFEEDILTSEAEGLGMGMTSRDTLDMLGVKI